MYAFEDGEGFFASGTREPLRSVPVSARANRSVPAVEPARPAAALAEPDAAHAEEEKQEAVVPSPDNDPDFPDEFCSFLQRCVSNVDAAELLLLVFKNPEAYWEPRDLSAQLAPAASLSEADVQRYLDVFQQCALIGRDAERRVQYRSAPEHDGHIATLARLYVERPVTLFRMIYALRDTKISTFADAFKLRR